MNRETWPKRPLAAALAVLLVALPLLGRDARAAFDFNDTTWQGSSELLNLARAKLGTARVRVIATVPWDEIQPVDALLLLHPERELDYREVAAFLAAGGRVGLFDDYGKGDALLSRFRIHRVRAPLSPRDRLRENPNLPIATPSAPGADSRPHPIVEGVDRVVTNHPTGLETDPGLELTRVLELPGEGEEPVLLALIGVIGDAKRCGLVGDGESVAPQGHVEALGRCGRLLAHGDPSTLMNLMLRYPGNRKFAERLVEYLVGDDTWGHRGGTLYIAANDIGERGSFGQNSGFLGAVEDRLDALARLISQARREGLPAPLAFALSALAALGAVVWAITAATRRYRRATPRYARATPLVAQGGLAGRAAVLAANTTHRALAVLELKAALEEALRGRLGLPTGASTQRIQEEIDGRDGLGRRNSTALGELFRDMARAESAVVSAERLQVTESAVRSMHEKMKAVLDELDERLGKRP